MSTFKCKMCGGMLDVSDDQTVVECDYCGTKQTIAKSRDEVIANLFTRANNLRLRSEFERAEQIYEKILEQDYTEAEAHWCIVLCRYGIEYVEDPKTGRRIPTCHRTSYKAVASDPDYLAAMEYGDIFQRAIYQEEAKTIDTIQKNILDIVKKEEPFDVFICYKETDENGERTRDSIIADDIYYHLTQQGLKVFFAAITLKDKLGQAYEPYIFAALNSAKVMLVLGTKPEYFTATWVKNEWSRFLQLMRDDRSKLLIPCYRDMDAYDLPGEFAHLQAQDMGKIGFINDVVRGIRKVTQQDEMKQGGAAEAVSSTEPASVTPLVQRAFIFLEDGDWNRANEYCEKALDLDPKNAQAYLCQALVELKCNSLNDYVQRRKKATEKCEKELFSLEDHKAHIDSMAEKYWIANYLTYPVIADLYDFGAQFATITAPSRLEQLDQEEKNWNQNRLLQRAEQFASGDFKKELTEAKESLLGELSRRAEEAKIEDQKKIAELRQRYAEQETQADIQLQQMHEKALRLREQDRQEQARQEQERLEQEKIRKLEQEKKEQERLLQEQKRTEENYRAWQSKAKETNSIYVLRELKGQFARIEKFEDADFCAQRIREIEQKDQVERETSKKMAESRREKIRRRDKMIRMLIVAVILLCAIAGVYFFVLLPKDRYSEALTRMKMGDYQQAYTIFSELGDYERSEYYSEKIGKYLNAVQLMKEGNYRDAIPIFQELGKSFGSQENLEKCLYQLFLEDPADYLSCGEAHTVALQNDGTVIAAGNNDYGQCDVHDWKNMVAVSAGYVHTVGLTEDGKVLVTGESAYYDQYGVRKWQDITAVSAGFYHVVGLKADGTVVATGQNGFGQCNVQDWEDIIAVGAGESYSVGLKKDGTVVITDNPRDEHFSQEYDVSEWEDIVSIVAAYEHIVGRKADGTVVAVGNNNCGQCDVEQWRDIVAISAGDRHTVGLKSDGTVVATGNKEYFDGIENWTQIIAIAANGGHNVGMKADGTLICVGDNSYGQCDVTGWTNILPTA